MGNLVEGFANSVRAFPTRDAVRCGARAVTYRELDDRVNALAAALIRASDDPSRPVGILLERSVDMIAAALAALRTGSSYVPMDPATPTARLELILDDADPSVVVTTRELAGSLAAGLQVVCVDDELPVPAQELPHPGIAADSRAYIIFTSGTTGRPKGVQVSHGNVLRLFSGTEALFGFGCEDVWSLFHSFAFDFSVWEMWGALLYGGCVVVVEQEVAKDPRTFWELLQRERVTMLSQTPTAFNQLTVEDAAHAARLPLRWVVFGGEALHFGNLRRWVAKYGDDTPQLINMYGITETTVHASFRRVLEQDLSQAGSLIGLPLPDLGFVLVDDELREVPAGEVGEIVVTGPGVTLGYLGRPDLTRERFVELPGHSGLGYRSGDLARITGTGEYEYQGRADDQVKIRGFRIELGEIQAVLSAVTGITQAAVVVTTPEAPSNPVVKERSVSARITDVRDLIRGGSRGDHRSAESGPRIVAYVVRGEGFDPAELFSRLRERLPHYMIPAFVVPVDSIPMNHNGKVDRKELPAASAANCLREPAGEASGAPAGGSEDARAIVEIFEDVIGITGVTETDSFFSIGGDSIMALQLRAQALGKGITLELRDIYALQTPLALAEVAVREQAPETASPSVAPFSLISDEDRGLIPDGDVVDAYPVGTLQAGLLFHSAYEADVNMYCDIFMFRLKAAYDHQAMERAVARAVDRHEILRTSFDFNGYSEPLQLVHAHAATHVTAEDLRHLSPSEQEAALDSWQLAERGVGYDWTNPPLMRFTVHELADDEFMFSMSFHDALLDGWSESSLITEILADYWALRDGAQKEAAARPVRRYADYIALEQGALADPAIEDFWRQELEDTTPTMLPRLVEGPEDRHEGTMGFLSVDIDPQLSHALDDIAREHNVSLKHVLLAVHARVLSCLTGSSEVVLGVESNGRSEEEGGADVMGVHLNVVPYKLNSRQGAWNDLIAAAFAKEQQLLPVRRFPYARLQRLIDVRELTDISFNYTHFHSYEQLASATALEVLDAKAYIQTHFTLRTEFNKDPFTKLLSLDLEANMRRMTEDQLRLVGEVYRNALDDLAADPRSVPSQRTLLGEERWHRLLDGYGEPAEALRADGFFPVFEERAATHADRIAALCGTETITYERLAERAGSAATVLHELGAGPGTVVGVVAERNIDYLVATLAVMRTGAIYLPLPAGPVQRVAAMLRTSGADLVLCDGQTRTAAEEATGGSVRVAELGPLLASAEGSAPYRGRLPGGRDDAYIIFTSGSTGEPKGALLRHDGMLNHIQAKLDALEIRPGDRVSQDAAATFDISVWQMLAPLAAGATAVIYPDAVSQDPSRLLRAVAEDGITVLEVSPTVLSVFAAELAHYGNDAFGAFALRWVVSSGETLTPKCANAFRAQLPDVRLLNMWGATEVSDDCTHYEVVAVADERAASVQVGRPIRNAKVYVLDDNREPVPVGTPGELYVGGLCVGGGYVNNPERTAAAFVPDPFGESPEVLAYRTGDRGRQLADGGFEFLGRIDTQLKIRGHRIELGEVERALATVETLQESAVTVRADGEHGKQLVGFYVPKAVQNSAAAAGDTLLRLEVSPVELRDRLGSLLPRYAVPDYLIALGELPRTPHGKVDTKALAAWDLTDLDTTVQDDSLPPTPTEAAVIEVWAGVLRTARPPAALSNFFALGGHSLHAAQVMARLRDRFGVDLPLRLLFENPTPRALAHQVEELVGSPAAGATPPSRITPLERRPREFPLARNQASLWFLNQVDPQDRSYENTTLLHLRGDLDVEALRSAVDTLAGRHEILSMRFGNREGVPYQTPRAGAAVRLEVVDASHEEAADAEAMKEYVRRQTGALRFDLERGPLVVARLYRFTPTQHVLQWSSHHVVSDGWSTDVAIREITEAYLAHREGRIPRLPELPVQYGDYALWQQEQPSGAGSAEAAFWRTYLDGYQGELALVTDQERTEDRSRTSGHQVKDWEPRMTRRVGELARARGVTPFMVFHAATAAVLSRFAQQSDLVIGSAVAGRGLPETANLIGYFADTLPFRYHVEPQTTGARLLDSVASSALSALEHQQMPFQEIVREAGGERTPGVSPLVQVLVTVDNFPLDLDALPGISAALEQVPPATALFDLLFRFVEDPSGLHLTVQYDATLFTPATVERLVDAVDRVLEALLEQPDTELGDIVLTGAEDLAALQAAWQAVSREEVDFAHQAARAVESPQWPDFLARVEAEGLLSALLLAL
ncbi:amino acid adenylation domain-containing protein [Streptomyces sp. NBC_00539]|uniref:amino acid adenylation domain-containing protein n=1 Tax=Streptomyces sp. NBC_00539 TaxID=2975770 RepID=UPI002E82003C|nr:amino acid adenylation domain-containing protein [Streptomyces sp. NBC_00539]WUC63119.1 amino acid adenylation domain-containing protein [Streptomyces sp. NBC_00539]